MLIVSNGQVLRNRFALVFPSQMIIVTLGRQSRQGSVYTDGKMLPHGQVVNGAAKRARTSASLRRIGRAPTRLASSFRAIYLVHMSISG